MSARQPGSRPAPDVTLFAHDGIVAEAKHAALLGLADVAFEAHRCPHWECRRSGVPCTEIVTAGRVGLLLCGRWLLDRQKVQPQKTI